MRRQIKTTLCMYNSLHSSKFTMLLFLLILPSLQIFALSNSIVLCLGHCQKIALIKNNVFFVLIFPKYFFTKSFKMKTRLLYLKVVNFVEESIEWLYTRGGSTIINNINEFTKSISKSIVNLLMYSTL